ncbi:MAG: hypothetical protein ABSC03_10520 [Verrucomicrobiota bacterium]
MPLALLRGQFFALNRQLSTNMSRRPRFPIATLTFNGNLIAAAAPAHPDRVTAGG